MDSATTVVKLLRVGLKNATNHKQSSSTDIDFAAQQLLRELKTAKKVNEEDVLSVRLDAKQCLIVMVDKLLDKSPLGYPLVRSL